MHKAESCSALTGAIWIITTTCSLQGTAVSMQKNLLFIVTRDYSTIESSLYIDKNSENRKT